MDFQKLIYVRYSVRDFLTDEIEEDQLDMILNAARMAPSAVNLQPYKIYVFRKGPMQDQIKLTYHREWIKNAPVVLVVTGLHQQGWRRASDGRDYTDVDAAIMIDHLTLQAADLGLGTCWVCNFNASAVSKHLKLDAGEEPLALIPLGYPGGSGIPEKKRKSMSDLVVRC